MAKYIKELLDLPQQVSKGDFVLKLTDGVTESHASATLQNYVVTPQLERCFDQALGKSVEEVMVWKPPAKPQRRGRRRAAPRSG